MKADLIDNPLLYRLLVRVGRRSLDVAAVSRVADGGLVCGSVMLRDDAPDRCAAIEDAVYANDLLLADFARIDIVMDSSRFVVLPDALDSADLREAVLAAMLPPGPDGRDEEAVLCPAGACGASVAMLADAAELRFLRRTFNNPRIHHPLSVLAGYMQSKSRLGNSGKMFVNLRQGTADVLAFGPSGLTMANSFACAEPADAVYYILASRRELGLGADDEMLIYGPADLREPVMTTLRDYVGSVMPFIFPAEMLRAGADALKLPLDLILVPLLCE